MKEIFKPKMEYSEKESDKIKKTKEYRFVKNNKELFDSLYAIENQIYRLVSGIKKHHMALGEMDKKKIAEENEKLIKEEVAILDSIMGKMGESKNKEVLVGQKFIDAYKSIDDEEAENSKEESEESDDNCDENVEDEEYDNDQEILERIKKQLDKRGEIKNNEYEDIKDADQERLRKVRELLKVNLDKGDKSEIFNPQREFLKIKKTLNNKKELLKKYKSELGAQLLGISSVNNFLENEISDNENIDFDFLYSKFEKKSKELKLSEWQIKRYEMVFEEFKKARKENEREWEMYKNKKANEVVRDLTEIECNGKIEMENHGIALVFYVYDLDDYVRIHSYKDNGENLTEDDYENAKMTGGFHMLGLIFINQLEGVNLQLRKTTIDHEMKHRINELIANGMKGIKDDVSDYFYSKTNSKNIKEYFENELMFVSLRARDEIFAFFKTGNDVNNIKEYLFFEGGPYDYLGDDKYFNQDKDGGDEEDEILEKYSPEEIENELGIIRLRYKKIISEGLEMIDELESYGFSRGKIIGIFQTEPITKWKKIFERLECNPHFLQEVGGNIEKLEEDLAQYRKNNSWIKRKTDKMKYWMPFGLADKFSRESYLERELEYRIKIAKNKKEILEKTMLKMK